jgi:uncharacterized protein (TIGR02452 family)
MNQIQMFRQTMAAFKADPEWPTSHLITESLPETPALGDKKAPWRAINADVFAVMSAYNQNAGVMNFASPTNPGGGVEYGAKAQEESIARGTYLVPALRQFESSYYAPNRADANGGLNTPNMIYSKRVRRLFDYDGQRLVGAYVDVATVAAPNLRRYPNLDEDLALKDIAQKVLQTLRAFKANGVRVPILGAFGCGVFGNSPYAVGKIFGETLRRSEFDGAWEIVVFALFDPNGDTYSQFVKGLKNQES